ncbi:uncharacterized protein [Nicotiana sylvestris]|uniref:uncharacterized protein n=1 Tax=Nicotiana sylvestris TaxID=4096 RepID=UPI00388C392B
MGTEYQLVVEIARRIEGYRQRVLSRRVHTVHWLFRLLPVGLQAIRAAGRRTVGLFQVQRPWSYEEILPQASVKGSAAGIISVGDRDASVLFDPGSTYSYVYSIFARFLVISPEPLVTPVHVSTPVGNSVVVDQIYRSCVLTFCGFKTRADLLLLDMIDFEVIFGMDCLSPYHAVLDCHAKTV